MNNVQCRKCAFYTPEWCPKKRDSLDPDLVRDCDYYRVKTNYDRICGFNEEEMAGWMVAEQISAIFAFLNGLNDDDLLNDFTEEAKKEVRGMVEEKLHWLKEES